MIVSNYPAYSEFCDGTGRLEDYYSISKISIHDDIVNA